MQAATTVHASPVDRRHPVDVVISKSARCSDPRSTYTSLFFSENPAEAARAKAICARCQVRGLCLARAIERGEPFGVWGGEFLVDGQVVSVRRGRGRPRKVALPTVVDEVTGLATGLAASVA
jgi:WhiB family redox-sensing transcriptional regulator